MNEVKKPQKPLIFYYAIVIGIILAFNLVIMPLFAGNRVKEVDYGTFMEMTENRQIGLVEV